MINAEGARVLRRNLERITALLIGPGLGFESDTQVFLSDLLVKPDSTNSSKRTMGFSGEKLEERSVFQTELPPMVIDADGLRLLAKIKDWHQRLRKMAVLTPHPGEMSALTGLPVEEIQRSRVEIALESAQKWGHVVVLKGALTVTADPSGKFMINPVATSALATAGTGDVLAGMIVGLLGQGLTCFSAAISGVWLHAQAGILAAKRLGSTTPVKAGDILKAIPDALKTTTGTQY
jgi:NAD(P)H-hydrate epimerase